MNSGLKLYPLPYHFKLGIFFSFFKENGNKGERDVLMQGAALPDVVTKLWL